LLELNIRWILTINFCTIAVMKKVTHPTGIPKTVDEYFARLPEPARIALSSIREAIRSVVPPGSTEVISYRIPAFRNRRVLVWYAAFSGHCSVFPTAAIIEAFKEELGDYATSKGTIQFPLGKRVPLTLVKKVVKARVASMKKKKKKKKR
jgi:uncharacterized protein YdhG (YjbR/CyaY superfamily)